MLATKSICAVAVEPIGTQTDWRLLGKQTREAAEATAMQLANDSSEKGRGGQAMRAVVRSTRDSKGKRLATR